MFAVRRSEQVRCLRDGQRKDWINSAMQVEVTMIKRVRDVKSGNSTSVIPDVLGELYTDSFCVVSTIQSLFRFSFAWDINPIG